MSSCQSCSRTSVWMVLDASQILLVPQFYHEHTCTFDEHGVGCLCGEVVPSLLCPVQVESQAPAGGQVARLVQRADAACKRLTGQVHAEVTYQCTSGAPLGSLVQSAERHAGLRVLHVGVFVGDAALCSLMWRHCLQVKLTLFCCHECTIRHWYMFVTGACTWACVWMVE